jgi:hypothetical protein
MQKTLNFFHEHNDYLVLMLIIVIHHFFYSEWVRKLWIFGFVSPGGVDSINIKFSLHGLVEERNEEAKPKIHNFRTNPQIAHLFHPSLFQTKFNWLRNSLNNWLKQFQRFNKSEKVVFELNFHSFYSSLNFHRFSEFSKSTMMR